MGWREDLPPVRGRLLIDEPLAAFTWFRVGGPADVLFLPADEADLAAFLTSLPRQIPVTVLGVGSNLIVRDGGLEGVAIRLAGRAFAGVLADGPELSAGAGGLDSALARIAAQAGLAGLEFYAGIPGTIGGALSMNAGCYGAETAEVLVEARGVTREGRAITLTTADFGYGYRTSAAPPGIVWTAARYRGRPDAPEAIAGRMARITQSRAASQPIREKTGGSTFKNPPGRSAWKLIDEAGWRGRRLGEAMFSPLHANFMINTGSASAAELEALGERVRADVAARAGVDLEWEIRRIGRAGEAESR
ncbi:MAG TPA: UDP-N-acetylmuramate dehydrogenase [Caulobacteraceae bacterium]|jgi:UDP-N-acetylmuramate dehydrogenase|nr:UDP-N-acetylmuramate dehydrogenase [Caulobacteraceae bacterium]